MNLISPPTDSIYKFSAIAGLILFGYMGYFFFLPDEHEKKEHQLQAESSSLEARLQILKDELIYGVEPSLDSIQIQAISESTLDSLSSTRLKSIIYNSPHSIQKDYKDIYEDAGVWASQRDSHNFDGAVYHDINKYIFIALLYLGEIVFLVGFLFWFFKIQKPQDEEHEQKWLRGEFYRSNCQSCYKKIVFPQERGLESNGELSKNFCAECYGNGGYVEPELTFEVASQRLLKKLSELNYSHLRKRLSLRKLKKLSRWQRLTNW